MGKGLVADRANLGFRVFISTYDGHGLVLDVGSADLQGDLLEHRCRDDNGWWLRGLRGIAFGARSGLGRCRWTHDDGIDDVRTAGQKDVVDGVRVLLQGLRFKLVVDHREAVVCWVIVKGR